MPTKKTTPRESPRTTPRKPRPNRNAARRSGRSAAETVKRSPTPRRKPEHAAPDYAYVYRAQTPTHVMVPIEDYERMLLAEMAMESEGRATDEQRDWIDLDDYLLHEAGSRIAAARKAKGITQRQLGEKLGIAQTQVSRIERHPDRTTLGTLKRVARALGVDVGELAG